METPLFCVSLILGLGAAWNLAQLDHGLTFDHRPLFNTDRFREVRRGGFSWKWFRLTLNAEPLGEARAGPPVTLHIPDRKVPLLWRLDKNLTSMATLTLFTFVALYLGLSLS